MERVIGEFKNDGLLHLQFWEDEYNHNISDFAVPEVDAKKLYYELRDYFKQRVETAVHKKEELAREYSFNIPSEIYNTLKTDADRLLWKSETERAFEAGWDAACEDADGVRGHIKLWKEEFLDKACEFLETYPHMFMGILRSEMIDDFRKAMEE